MFQRNQVAVLRQRLQEPRRFIQILSGPRQTGKTTIARQVLNAWNGGRTWYASADEPTLQNEAWLEQQWELARLRLRSSPTGDAILILDEFLAAPAEHWLQQGGAPN